MVQNRDVRYDAAATAGAYSEVHAERDAELTPLSSEIWRLWRFKNLRDENYEFAARHVPGIRVHLDLGGVVGGPLSLPYALRTG
jgi:hypothetical protein